MINYPDSTIFIQIIHFLFLLFVLNMIFYRPIRRILSQRSDKEKDLHESIEGFRKKSDEYLNDLEESYKGARGEGFKEKDMLKQAGTEAEKEILQEAISLAEAKIGKAKDEIDRSIMGVRQSLEDELNIFSKELAEKILGRNV